MGAPALCPWCGADNSANTAVVDGQTPSSGDVSICAYCTSPSVFADVDGELVPRIPTAEELLVLDSDPQLAAIRSRLRFALEARRVIDEGERS